MSLYLKYRPQQLDDLVGQEHVKTTIFNAIQQGNISHAYIFSGPRGTGKTSTARLIAKKLTCDTPELEKMVEEGRFVDIVEIDAASNRGIDEIRDLREKIQFAPVLSKNKVYIIDEVHMLTKEAFNALLKTLEEPPAHAYFILATTEIHKVPETILSRCQHFAFQRIPCESIINRLKYICEQENMNCEREALEIIAEAAEGGLRNAISMLEQMSTGGTVSCEYVQKYLGLVSHQVVESLALSLISGKTQEALTLVQKIVYEGYDLPQLLRELIEHLRSLMLDFVEQGKDVRRILEVIEESQLAAQKVKASIIPQLPLEVACVKLGLKNSSEPHKEDKGGILGAIGFGGKKKEKEEQVSLEKEIPPVKEKISVPSVETYSIELTEQSLQENWSRILQHIVTPMVKTALKSTSIKKVDIGSVELLASTDFYRDTLIGAKGRAEVLEAFEKVFSKKVEIKVSKGEGVQITPKIQEDVERSEADKEPKENLADIAHEVFKGI